jgi:hypothetical protein
MVGAPARGRCWCRPGTARHRRLTVVLAPGELANIAVAAGRRAGRPAAFSDSPTGASLIYALLTGHPEREAGELVFLADLTGELRAWPHDTWAKLGVDPD